MAWRLKHRAGGAFFHNSALLHYQNTVRYGLHNRQIVADKQIAQPKAFLQPGQEIEHGCAHRDIERTDGFVQNDEIRARDQGSGDGDPEVLKQEIAEHQNRRAETQPLREKTGGSTFANPDPPGTPDQRSSWKLVDQAGCRGLRVGGAQVSEKHCNFLINTGEATAADIEALGELVRARVLDVTGVQLRWEIRRIGRLQATHS